MPCCLITSLGTPCSKAQEAPDLLKCFLTVLSVRGDYLLALKMANNGSLFEPGTRCNMLDSAVTGHILEPGSFGITTRATLSRD